MNKRWKILLGLGGTFLASALVPIAYVETQCRSPQEGLDAEAPFASRLPGQAGRRPEAQTWLTYPEWTIVYSAETYGRYLGAGNRPSGFGHWGQVRSFWSGVCAANRAAAAQGGSAHYKTLLYVIGVSFQTEMFVKAAYENTIGRLFELIGGHQSANDRYNAEAWQSYGAFMHQTPWYAYPFGQTLSGLWGTSSSGAVIRNWERRLALSLEYGAKAGYGGLIGWASGATLGRDELTLRLVVRAEPAAVAAVDPRFRPVARLADGYVAVETPRYEQFTQLMQRLAATPVALSEIAGNDDIFVTLLLPDNVRPPASTYVMTEVPLEDRPGWRRVGLNVKVPRLLGLIRGTRAAGGELEHVYDY
ncbi:MAG TPA: hypothetical protein VLK25_01290 [Allosphingosinicella sp.]|nr:hypothetical protein [Allosphingosinicella sp.]